MKKTFILKIVTTDTDVHLIEIKVSSPWGMNTYSGDKDNPPVIMITEDDEIIKTISGTLYYYRIFKEVKKTK